MHSHVWIETRTLRLPRDTTPVELNAHPRVCMIQRMKSVRLTFSSCTQLDVFLKKSGKAVRIAELCHRAMPYPLIVVLHDGNSLTFSMAEKRFSRDGKEQVVLERSVCTE